MSEGLGQDSSTPSDEQTFLAPESGPAELHFHRLEWLRRQQALVAIGRRAISSPSLSVLMQDAAALIAETLGLKYYATAQPSPDEGTLLICLSVMQSDGAECDTFSQPVSMEGTESLAAYALQMAHPVAVSNVLETRLFRDRFLLKHDVQSALAAPLVTPEESFGVLVAGSSRIRRFEKEDLLFAETVSHLVTTRNDGDLRPRKGAETAWPSRGYAQGDSHDAFDVGPSPGGGWQATGAQGAAMPRNVSGAIPYDRRQRPRRSYPYHQLLAPIVGGKLPDPSEFTRVRCNDIASGGFSFLASEPPPSDLLMVTLGIPPNLTHLVAQVVHVNRIQVQGTYTYLVGCSYTGRVQH